MSQAQVPYGKQVIATGRLYRGVIIWNVADGFCLFSENGLRFDCLSETEAESLIDTFFAMSGRLIGALA